MKKEIKTIYFSTKEEAFKFIDDSFKEGKKGKYGYVAMDFKTDKISGCLVLDERELHPDLDF